MGQYNPHAPYIIGEEWVPIRNAHYVSDGVTERGYTFTIDAVTVPVSGAFYVEERPGNFLASACDFISVYPSGQESLTGPIKRVRIPASAITVTNVGVPSSIDVSEGVGALLNPEDRKTIIFDADTGSFDQLQVSFDTNAYATILLGKRIVDLRLRYQITSLNINNSENMIWRIHNQNSFNGIIFPSVTDMVGISDLQHVSTLSLTEMNPAWDATADFTSQRTVLPWRFQELNRFRATEPAASALTIFMQNNAEQYAVFLGFLELEVLYCEETRVLYGGFRTYDTNFSGSGFLYPEFYGIGAIAARLYSPATHTIGATLPAGEYVVTIYHRDMASRSVLQGAPKIHALREYYQLPRQRGKIVRQTLTPDDQFTVDDTDVLTQITLHTATQIVTGVHPYGTQYGAPVYGARTVVQEIEDNPGSSNRYPQVRFYARRYGNTTVPLTLTDVATGLSTVSISVADFDALDEIVDGWREVNLRFTTAPTFTPTTGDVDWRWSATGELAGNQWQIMVADGPTGAWQPNPAAAATGPATYWAPLGSQVALTWQSPAISGVAEDTTSDAVLIFSQDPPSVTGFAVALAEQELDVAVGCDTTPRCVPTALDYVSLTWGYGTACADMLDVLVTAVDTDFLTIIDVDPNQSDIILRGVYRSSTMPTGANFEIKVAARYFDSSNYVGFRMFLTPSGTVTTSIQQLSGGIESNGGFPAVPGITSVDDVNFAFYAIGTTLSLKVWKTSEPEPLTFIDTFTTTVTAPGDVRIGARFDAGVTNALPVLIQFEGFVATPPANEGTYLELQRYDAIDGEWKTIMLSSDPCPSSFDDYEARVGQTSWYRLRTLNVLDFAGPWVTGSATVPSPGVSVAGSANSVLIFTSNQQPGSNLAYIMQFENQPVETFSFPEADTVSLQRLFGRDFFLAIRPLERGGERFSRVLLVNSAAIPVPSLANFRGLRDLAWADLDYVCVRDELGNRWFATVIVPDGGIHGDRTIYMARIDVAEVTNTPTQVDP